MLPRLRPLASRPPTRRATPIGVGIDTSRYGHYAAFLAPTCRPPPPNLRFAESAAGYAQLRQRLVDLVGRARPRPLRRPPRCRRPVRRQPAPLRSARSRDLDRGRLHPLLRRPATQQELPRRPLRPPEVRPGRGPRLRPLCPHRAAEAECRRCRRTASPCARSPAAPGRRPPTHPADQPAPPPPGPHLPRTGPARQGHRHRLGPRTAHPLPHRPRSSPRPPRPTCTPSPTCRTTASSPAGRTPATRSARCRGPVAEELVRDQVRQLRDARPGRNAWKTCWLRPIATCPTPTTSPPSPASATSPRPSSPPSSSTSTASTRRANWSPTSACCRSRRPAASTATARRAARSATS